MKIWKIELVADSDFHTYGDSKGSTLDYLKDAEGKPVIPGTHVKGVMRTEAERILRSIQGIDCWITGDLDMEEKEVSEENRRRVKTCEALRKGEYGCDVCRIFGVPSGKGGKAYREGKIRLTNFRADKNPMSVSRMHVSIDRNKLSKKSGALHRIQLVPAGTRFTGYIITKKLCEGEEKLLEACLHSMVDYGLGGERSRGLGSFKLEPVKEVSYEDFVNSYEPFANGCGACD
jgi:CRISPR-associated protein Csm3